ncbi:olfactory receptor 10A5-like [Microcaecilia unicolor]|uniref:Olfactory receptor n=1 Tax=Microcaecilia unicolor TaxID=1415580 RepID=A0A6P7WQ18_9AMPH|nr:olfactory receptor 10A5-like [Microcaecilia unicolor]
MTWRNQTSVMEFVLLAFSHLSVPLPILMFTLFLLIYFITLSGNLMIIALVTVEPVLNTPMYFFLRNLSFLEICYTSVILPKMLQTFLLEENHISFAACAVQLFSFTLLAVTESFLLATMAYDRYVAICNPLHYTIMMSNNVCARLAASSWAIGTLVSLVQTSLIFNLPYCGPNKITHFFCDIAPLLNLACSDTRMIEFEISLCSMFFGMTPCLLVVISYASIITAILKIHSSKGRSKVFSTCASHLTSVSLFYGSGSLIYVLPKSIYTQDMAEIISLFYLVVTPLLNPLIYSLRNKEMKTALRKLTVGQVASQKW